jgi:hypothetical protein
LRNGRQDIANERLILEISTSAVFIWRIPRQLTFDTGLPEDAVFEGGIAARFQLFRGFQGLLGWLRNSFKSNCFLGDE